MTEEVVRTPRQTHIGTVSYYYYVIAQSKNRTPRQGEIELRGIFKLGKL